MKPTFYSKNNHAAIYLRLSKEDSGNEESVSIENQRKMLKRYINENGFSFYDEYVDDGYSGTTLERPGLQKMICDISAGKIGIVLTKDFSRLGRNSGKTLNLIDDFFTKNKVRFIAVTDGIDTACDDNRTLWMTPFVSAITEAYAADISRKINASLNTKVLNGEFIGAFAPFGYKKDSENKNHIIPDEKSAEIVRGIFTLAKSGMTAGEIAMKLNEESIPTPSQYRSANYKYNGKTCSDWSNYMVKKIISNEIYTGTMVQGKTHKPNFKVKYTSYIPKENWIRVENMHQPLVDAETWNAVHRKNAAIRKKTGFINIFSGIAKCADCGKNMSTAINGKTINLVCGGYKLNGKKECTNHRINYNDFYNVVLKTVNRQIYPKVISELNCEVISKLISRIDVHQSVSVSGDNSRQIDIYLKFKVKNTTEEIFL